MGSCGMAGISKVLGKGILLSLPAVRQVLQIQQPVNIQGSFETGDLLETKMYDCYEVHGRRTQTAPMKRRLA